MFKVREVPYIGRCYVYSYEPIFTLKQNVFGLPNEKSRKFLRV